MESVWFLGGFFINFNEVLPGNETVIFLALFCKNVSLAKVICICMLLRQNVFFIAFCMKFYFLAF